MERRHLRPGGQEAPSPGRTEGDLPLVGHAPVVDLQPHRYRSLVLVGVVDLEHQKRRAVETLGVENDCPLAAPTSSSIPRGGLLGLVDDLLDRLSCPLFGQIHPLGFGSGDEVLGKSVDPSLLEPAHHLIEIGQARRHPHRRQAGVDGHAERQLTR